MRNEIKSIRRQHERDQAHYSVDELPIADYDDVGYPEWLHVHEHRRILLDEIDRLYRLLRRRRNAA